MYFSCYQFLAGTSLPFYQNRGRFRCDMLNQLTSLLDGGALPKDTTFHLGPGSRSMYFRSRSFLLLPLKAFVYRARKSQAPVRRAEIAISKSAFSVSKMTLTVEPCSRNSRNQSMPDWPGNSIFNMSKSNL